MNKRDELVKNVSNELSSVYEDQENLNRQRNILKMDVLPRAFKRVEESKVTWKNAIASNNPLIITTARLDLCKRIKRYQAYQNELIAIRVRMNENHSRIKKFKSKVEKSN